MLQRTFCTLLIALGSLPLAGRAAAAEGPESTVSGSGTVTIHPSPTRLRMQMALRAYGKTPDAALENLKARREAAVARLKALKADEASISFGTPRVGPMARAAPPMVYGVPYGPPVARPVESYAPALPAPGPSIVPVPTEGTSVPSVPPPVAVRPPSWTPPPSVAPAVPPRRPAKNLPRLFTASATLKAEWPLPPAGDGAERLAATAADIQEKVRTADLANGGPQKLSAEEQELIEEAQMGLPPPANWDPYSSRPNNGWTTASTGPGFFFVAVLSDAQRKAALANACAQAKQDAAELAEAAGMRLGPITSLNRNTTYNFSPNVYSSDEGEGPSPLKKSSEFEAVAANADGLEFSIGVSVSYRLLPAGWMQTLGRDYNRLRSF